MARQIKNFSRNCLALGVASVIAVAAQADSGKLDLNIDSQAASRALVTLSQQSGVQIIFTSDTVEQVRLANVNGRYTLVEALDVMLKDSGLVYRFTSDDTVVIKQGEDGAEEEEGQSDVEEEIVVTGSRIKGVDAESSSPIFTIDRQEIERRGISSVEDLIRYLPQNFSERTSGGQLDGRNGEIGVTTINLRGLGEGASLILVNGKRISASPGNFTAMTDVSTIPFAAIERVEILADGGSAIYGSDAVGGVVNFILKSDYQGAETTMRHESSSTGADRTIFAQTIGKSWDSGNLTATFRYRKDDPALTRKTGIDTDGDFREQGGRYFPSIFAGAQPGVISQSFGPPVLLPGAPSGWQIGILPAGDGTNIDPDDIRYVTLDDINNQTGNFDLVPVDIVNRNATSEFKQQSAHLALSQQLGEHVELEVNVIYSRQDAYLESDVPRVSGTVGADHFYNPFDVPVNIAYRPIREIEDGLIRQPAGTSDIGRYGFDGSLTWQTPWNDWEVTSSFAFGTSKFSTVSVGNFDFGSPTLAEGFSSSDPDIAFNLFGDGSIQSASFSELFIDDDRGTRRARQRVVDLVASGTVANMPGGEVRLAIGGEMRTDTLDFTGFFVDFFEFRNNPDAPRTKPESENHALFGELFIPLVGDENSRPGVRKLNLQLAGRFEKYRFRGFFEGPDAPASSRTFDKFLPKIGIAWRPVEDIKVRASWGEAFQAPTLFGLFRPEFEGVVFGRDPGNPEANGGPNAFIPFISRVGGNPDLKPQQSVSTTVGFDYTPGLLPGLSLSGTWIHTEFTDLISTLRSVYGFALNFPLLNSDLFPDFIERDENGVLQSITSTDINLEGRISKSLDFEARYQFDTSLGEFTAGVIGTHTISLSTAALPGLGPVQLGGTDLGPVDWRFNSYLDWARDNWSASVTVNRENGYTNTDTGAVLTRVSGYTTVDLQANYELPHSGWRFSIGGENIFDADFPFVDNDRGVDSARVDFRRRVVYLSVNKSFSW